jgi:hypothetical protein
MPKLSVMPSSWGKKSPSLPVDIYVMVYFNAEARAQDRDTCECGNEPSGSIKCGEFLDYLASQEGLCPMQ